MAGSNAISDRAMALAADGARAGTHPAAVAALITLAGDDAGQLEQARDVLVRRIGLRSDDFQATSGLRLVNAALAQVGWADPMEWQPRKWRLPR